MVVWAFTIMISVHTYDHLIEWHGWKIGATLSMNFAKVSIIAWNYYDAGRLENPEKVKLMSEREKHYALPLRERLDFFSFINYF